MDAGMPLTPVSELIPVLQVAIGPVILISGVGLLLLTLTNRYGRTIDRSRQLMGELRACAEEDRQRLDGQVAILLLAGVSVLLASFLIIVLFLMALWKLEVDLLVSLLFILCMVALSGSLVAFIRDINLSLGALKLELGVGTAD